MKLNPDCIRDILLTVEAETGFSQSMSYPEPYKLLDKYSTEEVLYHIKQCELSVLLTKVRWFLNETCEIEDLSPQGHEFIANIRQDTNWKKVKSTAAKVGSFSLNAIIQIASKVIGEIISAQFQPPL